MVLTIKNFESQNVGPGVTETAPTNLVGVAGTLKATLTWTSATGESGVLWTEEKLVRKEGSAPQGSMDGTVVTTITTKDTYATNGYEDTGLDSTKTYYYKVFAIYDNGTERGSSDVNVTPEGYTPQSNTLLYMPLDGDTLDYSGNNNNGTWTGTTDYRDIGIGSKKYAYINQNSAISLTSIPVGTGNPNDFTFVCWTKTNTENGYSTPFFMGKEINGQRFNLIINYKESNYQHINDLYRRHEVMFNGTSPSNVGEWICVVYTYKNSGHVHTLYINNTPIGSSSTYSLNIGNDNKYIGRPLSLINEINYGLSEIIFESGIWTSEQISDYYNGTKGAYGL